MNISARTNRIHNLLNNHLKAYCDVVEYGGLSEDALGEIKGKAKGIVQEAKDELDQIKTEVDNW